MWPYTMTIAQLGGKPTIGKATLGNGGGNSHVHNIK